MAFVHTSIPLANLNHHPIGYYRSSTLLVDLDHNRIGTTLTKHQQPRYN